MLEEWILNLKETNANQIVHLIDEYETPIISFFPDDPEKAHSVACMLNSFYLTIKAYGEDFHRVFVTGVSKFSFDSMFSGRNQFLPLMERRVEFSTWYGFTKKGIRSTYGPFIEKNFDAPLDEIMGNIKRMYNGYRVHLEQRNEELLYNSWCILSFLEEGYLGDFWAKSVGSDTVMAML